MSARDTTPPTTEATIKSSPITPNPKRMKMGSTDHAAGTTGETQSTQSAAKTQGTETYDSAPIDKPKDAVHAAASVSAPALALAEEEEDEAEDEQDLEADEGYADSAFGTDNSDSTSITSSIYQGFVENGRRYQSKREDEYYQPCDEKQMVAQQKGHLVHSILDSERENPSFYSPIPSTAQNILDIGTGTGDWARDVADRFPSAFVQGVDLAPVPDNWMPPNCKFEVDDILKPWEFKENGRFDLVHLRMMYGSFTDEQWRLLYKQAYKNLAPGGWIEQLEPSIIIHCDDGTMPTDSILATCGKMGVRCFAKSGKNIDTVEKLRPRIEAAGFANIHEKVYKVPIGDWVKNPLLKEAGKYHQAQLLEGAEGVMMFLLTHFGEPTPWSPEEVQVYVAKYRNELRDSSIHGYNRMRRVWAQKPYDTEKEAAAENVA